MTDTHAKRVERERWILSYVHHSASALRRRVLEALNGKP